MRRKRKLEPKKDLPIIRKVKRTRVTKKRKNFFLTLTVIIILWGLFGFMVYFTRPDNTLALLSFFITLFLALLFTFSALFANTRRGLFVAMFVIIFLVLRSLGTGNIVNFLLMLGILISIEYYYSKR